METIMSFIISLCTVSPGMSSINVQLLTENQQKCQKYYADCFMKTYLEEFTAPLTKALVKCAAKRPL